jgi:hypothetical protein
VNELSHTANGGGLVFGLGLATRATSLAKQSYHAALWICTYGHLQAAIAPLSWVRVNLFHVLGLLGLVDIITRLFAVVLRETHHSGGRWRELNFSSRGIHR